MKRKTITIAAAATALFAALGGALYKAGDEHILFPPQIDNEILLSAAPFAAELFVDRSNSGVYDFVCNYALEEDGAVTLVDNEFWQSYQDIAPKETYELLKSLSSKELLQIQYTETGLLAVYHGETAMPVAIIELNTENEIVFQYEFAGNESYTVPCKAIAADKENLHIVSYGRKDDALYITTVNKADGENHTRSLTGEDLNAATGKPYRFGGFRFDAGHIWLDGDVLSFAATHYAGGSDAVIAAYDLNEGKTVGCKVFEGAQVMEARRSDDRIFLLLNRRNFTPLVFSEFNADTLEENNRVLLPLPAEFISADGAPPYFLFESDMNREQIAVLFPEHGSPEERRDGMRTVILAVYNRQTGEMEYRSRLATEAKYEISAISIQ